MNKGITLGAYILPFGKNALSTSKLVAEDMLFDHPVAELAVLNAKEKARAKQLTMMGGDAVDMAEDGSNPENSDSSQDQGLSLGESSQTTAATIKTLPKKTPRKLPKFMQRPTPETPDAICTENFRTFVKWALILIQNNEKITGLGDIEMVTVNMSNDLAYLIDRVNEEETENKVHFILMERNNDQDDILNNMETFGGFFTTLYNTNYNF